MPKKIKSQAKAQQREGLVAQLRQLFKQSRFNDRTLAKATRTHQRDEMSGLNIETIRRFRRGEAVHSGTIDRIGHVLGARLEVDGE